MAAENISCGSCSEAIYKLMIKPDKFQNKTATKQKEKTLICKYYNHRVDPAAFWGQCPGGQHGTPVDLVARAPRKAATPV